MGRVLAWVEPFRPVWIIDVKVFAIAEGRLTTCVDTDDAIPFMLDGRFAIPLMRSDPLVGMIFVVCRRKQQTMAVIVFNA